MNRKHFLVLMSLLFVLTITVSSLFAYVTNADEDTIKIRVGTYNIQHGLATSCDYSVFAEEIESAGLDIVGFQEVDKNTSRNGNQDTMKAISDASNGVYPYYGFSKAINLQGGEYGTGVISKYPIESYETIELPGPGEGRSMGHAVININGTAVDFYNTHLEWSAVAGRAAQLNYIKGIFETKEMAILTGDLNTSNPKEYAPSFPLCNFANGVGETFITNEDGPIDNIISTMNRIVQTDSRMADTTNSDHYMLWADLEILPKAALRAENGGFRFYKDGEYLKGLQTLGYDKMYFNLDTGLMVSTDFNDYEFEEFTACGKTLYRLILEDEPIEYPYITDSEGVDVTDKLMDGNVNTYIDGSAHWYFMPEKPIWTIQNGVLIIGGVGTLNNENFARFNDEINTIVVAPQDPSIKYGGDFGVQTGVILEEIASGAFAGLTNVTKAYIPSNVTLADDAFDAGKTPTLYRTAAKALTVAPATGYGIVNENGKTFLKLTVKDGDNNFILNNGQKVVLVYTDGEKNNEGGQFFCSALKYSELQPTYQDGVYSFDICAPIGADQFIPTIQATYIVNFYVLNNDGSIAALGSSKQFAIRCSENPIVENRTSDYVYLSNDNYITVDLGHRTHIDEFSLAFYNTSDRYFKWQLYGTNDSTLPLCKWDYIGEKSNDAVSSEGAYTVNVGGGFYRYLRAYCSYASYRWTALFAEVDVSVLNEEHNFGEWTITIEPTCTEDGEETRCCTLCGETETRPVEALGHNFGKWTTTIEPTCTEVGEETRYCTRCGETETRPVEALGHNFGEWTITIEPTCTKGDEETRHCTRCGETETRPVEALGHNFGEWTITIEPTCTKGGEETRYCTRCGETETRPVEKLGHILTHVLAKEPTETEDGNIEYYICAHCNKWYRDAKATYEIIDKNSVVIQALGTPQSVDYKIIEGANAELKKNNNKDFCIVSETAFAKVEAVKVDGIVIDVSNYTAVSGSTEVIVKSAYLDTLSIGNHTLTIVSDDGEATVQFTVLADNTPTSAGDGNYFLVLVMSSIAIVLSLTAIFITLFCRKRVG